VYHFKNVKAIASAENANKTSRNLHNLRKTFIVLKLKWMSLIWQRSIRQMLIIKHVKDRKTEAETTGWCAWFEAFVCIPKRTPIKPPDDKDTTPWLSSERRGISFIFFSY
jgi:hypothetical protein